MEHDICDSFLSFMFLLLFFLIIIIIIYSW